MSKGEWWASNRKRAGGGKGLWVPGGFIGVWIFGDDQNILSQDNTCTPNHKVISPALIHPHIGQIVSPSVILFSKLCFLCFLLGLKALQAMQGCIPLNKVNNGYSKAKRGVVAVWVWKDAFTYLWNGELTNNAVEEAVSISVHCSSTLKGKI